MRETRETRRQTGPPGRPCRRHQWRIPVAGDSALACTVCNRTLDLASEMTDLKYLSITHAYGKQHGPVAAHAFRSR